MANAAAAAARLAGVRPFAHIVARIHAVALDPQKTVSDLADVVERDVAFASRLLRLVNSPGTGLSQRCSSIRYATVLLGTKRVAHLATVTAACAFVEDSSKVAPTLAARAFAVGGISRMLASYAGLSADEAFTVGLLHDVGVLFMLQSGEPRYERLIGAIERAEPRMEDEVEIFGFDHTELGAAVLGGWNLPEPIPTIVRVHHDLAAAAGLGEVTGKRVALLRVADLLARHLPSSPEPSEVVTRALAEDPAVALLGIPPAQIIRIWSELREAIGAGVRTVPPPLPTLIPPRGVASRDTAAGLADVLEPTAPDEKSSKRYRNLIAAVAVLVALGIAGIGAREAFRTTTAAQSHR